jgi:hypothetical protein
MKRFRLIALVLVVAVAGCKKKTAPDAPLIPVTENKTGVALYPKSTEWGTGSSAGDANGNTATTRQTDDAPQKVIDFYKQEIRDAKVTSENFSDIVHTTITGKTKDGAVAEVVVMKLPEQKTQIFVSVRGRK